MVCGEFQICYGYLCSVLGQVNLVLVCNFVGQIYDCLVFIIEMLFKDYDDNLEFGIGWFGVCFKWFGQDVLSIFVVLVDEFC